MAAYSVEQYRKLINSAGLTIEHETAALFEQDIEDWLLDLEANPASRSVVREMMEAGFGDRCRRPQRPSPQWQTRF
ncbi:MAG: hypothetical protein R2867_24385 [Caldilineaceae bacterium]